MFMVEYHKKRDTFPEVMLRHEHDQIVAICIIT